MNLARGKSTGATEMPRIAAPVASQPTDDAARKRAAVELIARHEGALRRTARRFSLCADDADDAYQRALEILLTKAPTTDVRELVRWTTTVVKHEALRVRHVRERILGSPGPPEQGEESPDWVQLIPSQSAGPADQAERRELIARSREALQSLKPQELRALSLLAEGYSYAEISEITGFSHTKVNRCLAEGRERFRSLVSRSEDGRRCEELGPLLSAFCDGEAKPKEARELGEHLRACAHCRSTVRAYRAAPRAAAALVPAMPASRSVMERAHDALIDVYSRLSGRGVGATDSVISQVAAAGGTRGAGMAALAKVLAACVGTAGGAAACVAAGVVPASLPLDIEGDRHERPRIERHLGRQVHAAALSPMAAVASDQVRGPIVHEPPTSPPDEPPRPSAPDTRSAPPASIEFTPEASVPAASAMPATAVPPAPFPRAGRSSGSASGGPAAGEFGP